MPELSTRYIYIDIYYLHAIYLDISTADLGLVRVVDQRPLVPVEDEPALVPGLDPRPHLVEVAAAAAAVHHDVPAQLDLELVTLVTSRYFTKYFYFLFYIVSCCFRPGGPRSRCVSAGRSPAGWRRAGSG